MEIWESIKNFTNYEVSSYGRIRSKTHIDGFGRVYKGKLLKQILKNNYYFITLYNKDFKSGKTFKTSRLVAETFIPNLDNKPYVHHKDHNKANNKIFNLQWVTAKENMYYEKEIIKSNFTPILCIETGVVYESRGRAAKWLDENYFKGSKNLTAVAQNINRVCKGNRNKAYNYRWSYLTIDKRSTTSA